MSAGNKTTDKMCSLKPMKMKDLLKGDPYYETYMKNQNKGLLTEDNSESETKKEIKYEARKTEDILKGDKWYQSYIKKRKEQETVTKKQFDYDMSAVVGRSPLKRRNFDNNIRKNLFKEPLDPDKPKKIARLTSVAPSTSTKRQSKRSIVSKKVINNVKVKSTGLSNQNNRLRGADENLNPDMVELIVDRCEERFKKLLEEFKQEHQQFLKKFVQEFKQEQQQSLEKFVQEAKTKFSNNDNKPNTSIKSPELLSLEDLENSTPTFTITNIAASKNSGSSSAEMIQYEELEKHLGIKTNGGKLLCHRSPRIALKINTPKSAMKKVGLENLRKQTMLKSVTFVSPVPDKSTGALERYNTYRNDCVMLCTPKQTDSTEDDFKQHLSKTILTQCYMLQDTPVANKQLS